MVLSVLLCLVQVVGIRISVGGMGRGLCRTHVCCWAVGIVVSRVHGFDSVWPFGGPVGWSPGSFRWGFQSSEVSVGVCLSHWVPGVGLLYFWPCRPSCLLVLQFLSFGRDAGGSFGSVGVALVSPRVGVVHLSGGRRALFHFVSVFPRCALVFVFFFFFFFFMLAVCSCRDQCPLRFSLSGSPLLLVCSGLLLAFLGGSVSFFGDPLVLTFPGPSSGASPFYPPVGVPLRFVSLSFRLGSSWFCVCHGHSRPMLFSCFFFFFFFFFFSFCGGYGLSSALYRSRFVVVVPVVLFHCMLVVLCSIMCTSCVKSLLRMFTLHGSSVLYVLFGFPARCSPFLSSPGRWRLSVVYR